MPLNSKLHPYFPTFSYQGLFNNWPTTKHHTESYTEDYYMYARKESLTASLPSPPCPHSFHQKCRNQRAWTNSRPDALPAGISSDDSLAWLRKWQKETVRIYGVRFFLSNRRKQISNILFICIQMHESKVKDHFFDSFNGRTGDTDIN